MIVVLFGAPGSGKGTQAKAVASRFGLTHLSTGDIFRSEIAAKSAIGLKAQEFVKNGKLVPDDLVTEMVSGRLDLDGGRYLLDGFPRNIEQGQSFSNALAKEGKAVTLAVLLKLSNQEAMKRLTARRVCPKCEAVFNVLSRKPKTEGVCDSCQGDLIQRVDDTPETASKRLMVFEDLTQPLVSLYRSEGVFQEVDAGRPAEDVTESLAKLIDAAAKRKT